MAEITVGEAGGIAERKDDQRRSSGTRLSVFNAGVRSTGQFEIGTKVETMTFREILLLFFSMFVNSLPAVFGGIVFSVYQGISATFTASWILDELESQPTGWAPLGFVYKNYGKKVPPGPGPYDGTVGLSQVYGGRADLGDVWANVPSIAWGNIWKGYHGTGVPGHPCIGYMWGLVFPFSNLMITRLGLYSLSTFMLIAMFGSKVKGTKVRNYLCLGISGTLIAWVLDVLVLAGCIYSGVPRESSMSSYSRTFWWFLHTMLVYWYAKYGCGLPGAGRGILCPILSLVFLAMVAISIMLPYMNSWPEGWWLLFVRLVLWPLATESMTAPMRALLRSIPEEYADKSGLAFGMVPIVSGMGIMGRLFQYRIMDPLQMFTCNFALFAVEILFRLSVGYRDRFYARIVFCMSSAGIKDWFGQKHNVKFRCDNLINELIIEYYCMLVVFVQCVFTKRVTDDPDSPPSGGLLVLNLIQQVVLEGLCDTTCLYVEVHKLKAPVLQAWQGRKPHYPVLFAAILCGTGWYCMLSPLQGLCPMYNTKKQLVWPQCS